MTQKSAEKYLELNKSFNQNQMEWSQYERQSDSHFKRIRESLIEYLGCTNQELIWQTFPENFKTESGSLPRRKSVGGKTVLFDDNFWRTIFRLELDKGNVEFLLKLQREGAFFLLVIGANKEIRINKENLNDLTYVSAAIIAHIQDFLEKEFGHFVGGKPSIGFPMIDVSAQSTSRQT